MILGPKDTENVKKKYLFFNIKSVCSSKPNIFQCVMALTATTHGSAYKADQILGDSVHAHGFVCTTWTGGIILRVERPHPVSQTKHCVHSLRSGAPGNAQMYVLRTIQCPMAYVLRIPMSVHSDTLGLHAWQLDDVFSELPPMPSQLKTDVLVRSLCDEREAPLRHLLPPSLLVVRV